ncbi:hypothetical protein [Nannocystis radixulma]|uniref:Lipoprotein n=1 Tax=Nannocystis radixulma TaxID=2995305 RepID=A0ABT5BET7_9BACT|nr:hypothetical protein [Nannocystis radixulma]MDC0671933.1 hypothetical protein [Nannocystis radixulma]
MTKHILSPMALSLAALLACNPDKSPIDSSTDSSGSESAGSESSSGDPTGDPSGDPSSSGSGSESESESGTSSGGDTTEDPTGGTGTGEGGQACIDTPTVIAADAETALGISAQAFLADKLGPRSTTLTFASEPLTLADAWRDKQLPLTVELRYDGGEVRWIDSEINPEYEGEGFPSDCADRLEIDVGFDFVTEGLEFDEHRDGVLTVASADQGQLRVKLLPPGLDGSFDPATLYKPDEDPPWVVTGIEIGATFKGAQAGGSLLNEVRIGDEDDEGGIAGFGPVASWGDDIDP